MKPRVRFLKDRAMKANLLQRDPTLPIRPVASSLDLFALEISRDILELLPAYIVRNERTVPIDLDGDALVVALEDPADLQLQERIQFIANRELRIAVATRAAIDYLIEAHYSTGDDAEEQESQRAEA
jgi:hypothetical protein